MEKTITYLGVESVKFDLYEGSEDKPAYAKLVIRYAKVVARTLYG